MGCHSGRRVGPNCSPRSLRTPSPSPFLSSSSTSGVAIGGFSSLFFGVAIVLACLLAIDLPTLVVDGVSVAHIGDLLDALWASRQASPSACTSMWLGFAFDSTRGYPGEGPPFDMDQDTWLSELDDEVQLIEQLPFVVGRVQFECSDERANLNKVFVTVGCCWQSGRLLRVYDQCTETTQPPRPTHLEALRNLRSTLLRKHACEGHVHHPKAVARCQELAHGSASEGMMTIPIPLTHATLLEAHISFGSRLTGQQDVAPVFDRMRLAQARQQGAARAAIAAEKAAEEARSSELAATRAREAAEAEAKELRACATALQPKVPSHKKQRTAFEVSSAPPAPLSGLGACARPPLVVECRRIPFP